MKSIRLNKSIRESIANNILKAWLDANPAPQKPSGPLSELAKDIVDIYFADKDVKAAIKFSKTAAGKKYIHNTHYIRVRLPNGDCTDLYNWTVGTKEYFGYHKDRMETTQDSELDWDWVHSFIVSKTSSVQVDLHNEDYLKANPKAAEVVKAYNKARKEEHKVRKAYSAWELKRDNYMEQVNEVLGAVNTTGQLREQWEEVVQFIPDGYRNPSTIALPAVSTKALNAGLKK